MPATTASNGGLRAKNDLARALAPSPARVQNAAPTPNPARNSIGPLTSWS